MKLVARFTVIYFAVTSLFLLFSCSSSNGPIKTGGLSIEVNDQMQTLVTSDSAAAKLVNGFQSSEFLITNGDTLKDFKLKNSSSKKINDFAGAGKSFQYTGNSTSEENKLDKLLTINTYDGFPGWAFYKVQYINTGKKDILVNKWVNHAYNVQGNTDTPDFWSFQASSTEARKSWILPVNKGFYQRNYLGMNDPDYGGGIPVLDIWHKTGGIAIGHCDLKPQMVAMPLKVDSTTSNAIIDIEYEYVVADTIHPGDTLNTLETFVTIHKSDCFKTLQQYAAFMAKKGIVMPASEPLAFEPMWCAWGYMRRFTIAEVVGTLPKVKELGFTWVTLDDGYQHAEGDWLPNPVTFPGGEAQMKALVDTIHAMGFKAQIWWAPLAVDPGTKLLAEHPDIISKNADGSPQIISWWDSYYMSPAYQPTLDHTKQMVEMFIGKWGFDGLKLDGQHLNAAPKDYNPLHKLKSPDDAPENVPNVFKLIYTTAHQLKPDALVQLCPCGDAFSFYNMPYTNQFVASDPVGSTQVRSKGWTFKAFAPNTAYFGDHVELSDNENDFASTIGIGGVPGTKFTWPKDNPYVTEGHFVLSPEKEKEWKKWIQIYKAHMLSKGEYLGGLYDIGYDIPETHVIRKSDTLFYAFYANDYKGEINLKGLSNKPYKIVDYVDNRDLGITEPGKQNLQVDFKKYLLVMAYPVAKQ
ncbi:MAG: glycoside hydrolase family 36 protein [Omnitrophica WOR_2 bacterium]